MKSKWIVLLSLLFTMPAHAKVSLEFSGPQADQLEQEFLANATNQYQITAPILHTYTLPVTGRANTPPPPPTCIPDQSCDAQIPACETTTAGADNCGNPCTLTGGPCPCVSDGSCDAPTPACGQTTNGADNCGTACSKSGAVCPCVPDGSCSAPAPSCGQTTSGLNNCGGTCSIIGPACPPPPPPPPPGTFPASYDPSRLGPNLLTGNSWQGIVVAGTTDNGWRNLITAVPFAMGSSASPTNPGMLGVYPDAIFGQAVRISNLAGANGMTAQSHNPFTPTQNVWVRWTVKLQSTDAGGFSAATDSPGESGTYKMAFLWPSGNPGRQSFVLMSSGYLAQEAFVPTGVTQTPLVSTDPTTPIPAPNGSFQGIYANSLPTLGGPYVASDMRKNEDWYELVLNATATGPNESLQRWFMRRLTINGVWAPWPYPIWKGLRCTGKPPQTYHDFWLTGNKSGGAIHEQYMWLGPFEATNLQDPYGWDHYGK